jgi:hypothetical protein
MGEQSQEELVKELSKMRMKCQGRDFGKLCELPIDELLCYGLSERQSEKNSSEEQEIEQKNISEEK